MLVVVAAGKEDLDVLSSRLRAEGATVLEETPVGDGRILLSAGCFGDGRAALVVAGMRSEGWSAVVRPAGGGHLTAWRTHTRPVVVADRLWVCFPWSEFDRSTAEAVVEIDPGQAFGTGGHPSTRLLLEELAARLCGGENVLDVGCGSGVLAVSAARLGAGSVTAIDLNTAALAATRANAVRNHVGGTVQISPAPAHGVDGLFDVIVANIGAGPLIELAPALQARLAPSGWIGLSGLSPAQVSVVGAAYRPMRVVSVPAEDDWVAVVVTASRRDSGSGRPATSGRTVAPGGAGAAGGDGLPGRA